MLNIYTLIYGLIAGLLVGFHVFSVKWIQMNFSYNYYTFIIIFFSMLIWIISRIFLFLSYNTTEVSTFAHTLLFTGILVSIILDNIILNKPIKPPIYLGILFLFIGYYIIIQYGY